MPTTNGEIVYPLCAVQMGDFMFAPLNTEICMRRNIAGSLTSGGNLFEDESYILLQYNNNTWLKLKKIIMFALNNVGIRIL